MMTHKMTINLNMLGALMENIIMRNLNSTMVVTMYDSRQRMCKTHIFQQPAKSKKFRDSINQSTVLYLSARARHNMLFLTAPGNKRVPQKETKASSEQKSENHETLYPSYCGECESLQHSLYKSIREAGISNEN
jgi:hypothetical protein